MNAPWTGPGVAAPGLGHWYFLQELRGNNPSVVHVANRRFVVDRNVATTTGITASVPMMPTLIEAIAGRDSWGGEQLYRALSTYPPAQALDKALQAIGHRYGQRMTDIVALQLE